MTYFAENYMSIFDIMAWVVAFSWLCKLEANKKDKE